MSESQRQSRVAALKAAVRERILFLDGAKGAYLQRAGLTEADFRGNRFGNHERDLKGNFDILALTKPSALTAVHDAFLKAGSDIIQTNTFNANRVRKLLYLFRRFKVLSGQLHVEKDKACGGSPAILERIVLGFAKSFPAIDCPRN